MNFIKMLFIGSLLAQQSYADVSDDSLSIGSESPSQRENLLPMTNGQNSFPIPPLEVPKLPVKRCFFHSIHDVLVPNKSRKALSPIPKSPKELDPLHYTN